MPENLSATVIVRLEIVGNQYVHARLLSPWRSQTVGRSWKEIESKLKLLAEKELSRASPRKWQTASQLQTLPQSISIPVQLDPPQRNTSWSEPLSASVQGFRWDLENGMSLVTIPCLACDVFAAREQLTDAVISDQVHMSLVRLGERYHLLDVFKRFYQRRFEYRTLSIQTTIRSPGNQVDQSSDPKQIAARARKATVTLRATSSDLSRAELAPVYGRDQATLDIAEYLTGQTPQSLLLVGPAGVGKTSIVHRLVQMISHPEPEQLILRELKGRKIWSTTGSRLVSGMSGFGMWQERCLKLIREAHATRSILHVGSVMELMEAGKIEGQPGVASMIRQAVARGRLVIIGECTAEQIALIERDEPLLLRALVRYEVNEPSSEGVTDILRQAAAQASTAFKRKASSKLTVQTEFTQSALEELTRLHRRYATYSALPAQPLRLMRSIQESSPVGSVIGAADVARAFATQTGLPNFLVDDSVRIDLERIRQQLAAHLIGQPEPIELVVNLIATLKSRLVRPGRPLASMMFIGPTGVGKTEMAKAIARLLYSDTRRMVRIDMSEYATPWSAIRLIGRPDEGDGTLTSPIREQPFSVVLLDEFEKAHPTVFDLLLQLLGEGRLTDSLGRLADFRNAVVIMTSNLGVESFRESGFGFSGGGTDWRAHFEREVQRYVRPELLGRIDRIVPFAPLPPEAVRMIAQREIDLLKERPGLKYADIQFHATPEVVDRLSTLGYQPKYGARPLRRVIEHHLCVPLANMIASLPTSAGWNLRAEVIDGKISIEGESVIRPVGNTRSSLEHAIDQWQELGRMARLAAQCTPVRDLQNETGRLERLNDALFTKVKSTTNSRRESVFKLAIQQNAVKIERNQQLITQLNAASAQIAQAHSQVMLDWYNNRPISDERLRDLPNQLKIQLRVAVVNLLDGRRNKVEVGSLLIIGKPIAKAAVLWQAYERLAKEHHWTVERFTLKNYEAVKDRDSAEYRKRQSQKKSSPVDQGTKEESIPDFRLLAKGNSGTGEGSSSKTCDVYRCESSDSWSEANPGIAGVALQLSGTGISAWLQEEQGVMHFLDSSVSGPKRRLRYRVAFELCILFDFPLGPNWTEPVASPERDPRRTFHLVENVITDGINSHPFSCGDKQLVDCLLEVIRFDRERQLWEAIGFTGLPDAVTLRQGSEVVSWSDA